MGRPHRTSFHREVEEALREDDTHQAQWVQRRLAEALSNFSPLNGRWPAGASSPCGHPRPRIHTREGDLQPPNARAWTRRSAHRQPVTEYTVKGCHRAIRPRTRFRPNMAALWAPGQEVSW